MGTETSFELDVIVPSYYSASREEIIRLLRESCREAELALTEEGDCNQREKWYHHDIDLMNFSEQCPNVLFVLTGADEDNELWRTYYKNGQMQYEPAQITYGAFDENKLTSQRQSVLARPR
jgi:hypothetical protein